MIQTSSVVFCVDRAFLRFDFKVALNKQNTTEDVCMKSSGILPTLSRSAAFSRVNKSTGTDKCPRTYPSLALIP